MKRLHRLPVKISLCCTISFSVVFHNTGGVLLENGGVPKRNGGVSSQMGGVLRGRRFESGEAFGEAFQNSKTPPYIQLKNKEKTPMEAMEAFCLRICGFPRAFACFSKGVGAALRQNQAGHASSAQLPPSARSPVCLRNPFPAFPSPLASLSRSMAVSQPKWTLRSAFRLGLANPVSCGASRRVEPLGE
jgi:hypothetical protein